MINRFALDRSSRAVCTMAALVCFIAAFALTPTEVRSRIGATSDAAIRTPNAEYAGFAPNIGLARDPFVSQAIEEEPAIRVKSDPANAANVALPPMHLGPLPPNAGAGLFPFGHAAASSDVHVSAIALGGRPSAIVESNGATRVVGVGDIVNGSTVTAIDSTGLFLANGRRADLPSQATR